jgi:hypothetical protein
VCERYGLPWWAGSLSRLVGLVDRGMAGAGDVDDVWLQRLEWYWSERERQLEARHPPPPPPPEGA